MSPKDLARWAFWVPFRRALRPELPGQLRALYPLWRAQLAAAGPQKADLAEELVLSFGDARPERVQDAYRIAFRVHLEELLLGKLTPQTVDNYMLWEGREHLDAALSRGKGAVIVLPHAGNIMMMIARISLSGIPYTQYAARGLAPPDVAQAHPDTFGHNPLRAQVRAAREDNEDRLPARYLTLDTSVRELFRRLEANETVGITYDGRIGSRFVRVPYLGRQALLNPGAFRIAARSGAALVPIFNKCPADGPNLCQVGEPLYERDWKLLMRRFIQERAEPWLRANPAHYGLWLSHCRARRAVDDHPLFMDYAPDERAQKWPTL
ncbi:MAG: lysophospholipid acyltransferase family protein [Myxococcota bacterium]|nr:lysophospholipid acyltransferase family protein [Myxococcota bacterium]